MGTFLAAAANQLNWTVALLTLVTASLLQILSNLANDYGDSVHGADSAERVGPARAVQSGQISAEAMRRAIFLFVALSMLTGFLLVWSALGAAALGLVVLFLIIGALALAAAVAYTAGRKPYGYIGLGDLAVFLFFGWVAVCGSYFLQARSLPPLLLAPATSLGLFSVGVLNVNNIRDIESDAAGGKRSIPVRLGPRRARIYHWALLLGGFLVAGLYVLMTAYSWQQWLFLLTAPLFVWNGLVVWRSSASETLDPMLRQLSLSTIAFVVVFGIGQLL